MNIDLQLTNLEEHLRIAKRRLQDEENNLLVVTGTPYALYHENEVNKAKNIVSMYENQIRNLKSLKRNRKEVL